VLLTIVSFSADVDIDLFVLGAELLLLCRRDVDDVIDPVEFRCPLASGETVYSVEDFLFVSDLVPTGDCRVLSFPGIRRVVVLFVW
jgi:hypothetical protein